jgi:hypothetical protein
VISGPWHYALLAAEIAGLALLARFTRTSRAWLFALLWTLVVSLPSCLFARAVNSERYLFLPMLGIGFALALTVDALLRYRWTAPAVVLVLVVYAAFSSREPALALGTRLWVGLRWTCVYHPGRAHETPAPPRVIGDEAHSRYQDVREHLFDALRPQQTGVNNDLR